MEKIICLLCLGFLVAGIAIGLAIPNVVIKIVGGIKDYVSKRM